MSALHMIAEKWVHFTAITIIFTPGACRPRASARLVSYNHFRLRKYVYECMYAVM